MAAGGGSAADAKVGADILAATAAPRDAVKELRKELKLAYQEQDKLLKAGKTVQLELQNQKIEEIQRVLGVSSGLDKKTREIQRQAKQALAIGRLATSVYAAQSISRLLRGDVSAHDFVAIASLAATHDKAIARAFGTKAAGFITKFAPALPIIGVAVDAIAGGFQKARAMDAGHEQLGRLLQAGKIDASVYHRMNDSFMSWTNLGFDPTEMGRNVAVAAQGITSLNTREMRDTIVEAQRNSIGTLSPLAFNFRDYKATSAENILAKYRAEIEAALDAGTVLDDAAKSRIFQGILTSVIGNDRYLNLFSQKLDEATQKKRERQGPTEKRHTQLYWENEAKIQDQIEARRRFIPAKMEY